jgi:hypothetical protein
VPRAALPLWCIIHTDNKGTARVWLEAYGASAIGARLYAATAGCELEEGETAVPICNRSSRGKVPILPPDFEIDRTSSRYQA